MLPDMAMSNELRLLRVYVLLDDDARLKRIHEIDFRLDQTMNARESDQRNAASQIRCDSLSITFGDRDESTRVQAVRQANALIQAGQIVSLIGPSGCGKTTLLRAIAGLQSISEGSVTIDPLAVGTRGEIAFVFQQPSLLPWQTAAENVMLPLELIGRGSAASRREAAMRMLDTVQLSDAADRLPYQLSGGMKMRVSIARALVTRPRVLLLDEPFAALDDMLRNELGQLLLSLWRDQQFTAVLVTHNISEAILLSHEIAIMQDGKLSDPIRNPLALPRSTELSPSAQFGQFYGQISDALRTPDRQHGVDPDRQNGAEPAIG